MAIRVSCSHVHSAELHAAITNLHSMCCSTLQSYNDFRMYFSARTHCKRQTYFYPHREILKIVSPLRVRQLKNRMKSNKLHKPQWHIRHMYVAHRVPHTLLLTNNQIDNKQIKNEGVHKQDTRLAVATSCVVIGQSDVCNAAPRVMLIELIFPANQSKCGALFDWCTFRVAIKTKSPLPKSTWRLRSGQPYLNLVIPLSTVVRQLRFSISSMQRKKVQAQ